MKSIINPYWFAAITLICFFMLIIGLSILIHAARLDCTQNITTAVETEPLAISQDPPPFIRITGTSSSDKIFEIRQDGSVYWLKDGEYVQATTDLELGKALGAALTTMVRNNQKIEEVIKNQNISL